MLIQITPDCRNIRIPPGVKFTLLTPSKVSFPSAIVDLSGEGVTFLAFNRVQFTESDTSISQDLDFNSLAVKSQGL